jgi:hypothetical protein
MDREGRKGGRKTRWRRLTQVWMSAGASGAPLGRIARIMLCGRDPRTLLDARQRPPACLQSVTRICTYSSSYSSRTTSCSSVARGDGTRWHQGRQHFCTWLANIGQAVDVATLLSTYSPSLCFPLSSTRSVLRFAIHSRSITDSLCTLYCISDPMFCQRIVAEWTYV